MAEDAGSKTTGLPAWRILAFGALAMPQGALGLPLAIYLAPFYAAQLGLPLAMLGTALMVARLTDFITDPVVGLLSDRWRPRVGRRRVWLLIGTLIMLAGVQLLLRPAGDVSLAYFFAAVALVYLGFTAVGIPYQAWSAELSVDYHTRTRIASTTQGFNMAGLVVATAIPAWILSQPGATSGAVLNAIALFVMVALPVTAALVWLFVPEPPPPPAARRPDLKRTLALMWANRPFRLAAAVVFVATVGEVFRQTITVFFARDVVGVANIGIVYAVYFVCGLLAVPLWTRLAKRLQKHTTLIVAFSAVAATNFAMTFLGKGDGALFTALFVVKGITFGAIGILPHAMIADTVDIDTAQTGDRQQGLYFAGVAMVQKLGFALGGGLPLIVLGAVGYESKGNNTPEALQALTLCYGLVPAVLVVVATIMLGFYSLTRERQAAVRAYIASKDAGGDPQPPAWLVENSAPKGSVS